jgi:hypothetical protein
MYVKNTGKLFQLVQVSGKPVYLPKRGYTTMGKPQGYATQIHNEAIKHRQQFVDDYAWFDLSNFEIIEYEVREVGRHKHPLLNKETL